jgi:hypothetical protein
VVDKNLEKKPCWHGHSSGDVIQSYRWSVGRGASATQTRIKAPGLPNVKAPFQICAAINVLTAGHDERSLRATVFSEPCLAWLAIGLGNKTMLLASHPTSSSYPSGHRVSKHFLESRLPQVESNLDWRVSLPLGPPLREGLGNQAFHSFARNACR